MVSRESQIAAMAEELLKCAVFNPGGAHRIISANLWASRMWEAANGKKK